MVLNENINEFDKKEGKKGFGMIIRFIKETIDEARGYKELWEKQNILLDQNKVELRRKDKQIMRLKARLEIKERELKELKGE